MHPTPQKIHINPNIHKIIHNLKSTHHHPPPYQVPIFSKREDMFLSLCEYSVPMLRATWFIKMTSAYHESKVAESKIKKRQQPDIAQGRSVYVCVCVCLNVYFIHTHLSPFFPFPRVDSNTDKIITRTTQQNCRVLPWQPLHIIRRGPQPPHKCWECWWGHRGLWFSANAATTPTVIAA